MASSSIFAFENHLNYALDLDDLCQEDVASMKIQTILNKLTLEKYQRLSDRLPCLIVNANLMKTALNLIFNKALLESNIGFLYIDILAKLIADAPNFADEDGQILSFRTLLLNKCREEYDEIAFFVANSSQEERFDALPAEIDDYEELEQEQNQFERKRHLFGVLKLIGGLFVAGILEEEYIHMWIQVLIGETKFPVLDHIEGLCVFLKAIGPHINDDEPESRMNEHFETIHKLAKDPRLPTHVRFALMDVIETRNCQWIPVIPNTKFFLCSGGT